MGDFFVVMGKLFVAAWLSWFLFFVAVLTFSGNVRGEIERRWTFGVVAFIAGVLAAVTTVFLSVWLWALTG